MTGGRHGRRTPLGRRAPGHCARAAVPRLEQYVPRRDDIREGADRGDLALAIVFLAGSGGFTVTFETDGGSQVPAQTCRYGELVRRPEDPVKEGYVFDGWYWDVEREHRPWDFAQDTVEDSMYLYARWQPVP